MQSVNVLLVTSTLTTYLTPNTRLSTPRLRYWVPKINTLSGEQLCRATLPLPVPCKKPCCSWPPRVCCHTHNRLATCALANSTLLTRATLRAFTLWCGFWFLCLMSHSTLYWPRRNFMNQQRIFSCAKDSENQTGCMVLLQDNASFHTTSKTSILTQNDPFFWGQGRLSLSNCFRQVDFGAAIGRCNLVHNSGFTRS